MNTAFPLIAFGIAITAFLLSPSVSTRPARNNPLAAFAIIVAVLIGGYIWRDQFSQLLPAAVAFAVSVAICFVLRIAEGYRLSHTATAAGVAAGLSGITAWLDPSYGEAAMMASIVGFAFGAWTCSDFSLVKKNSLPLITAALVALCFAADFMGAQAIETTPAGMTGTLFGLATAVSSMLGMLVSRPKADRSSGVGGYLGVGILLILGYVVGSRLVESREAWMIFDGAVLVGLVLNTLIRPDGSNDSFSFLIGTVIWIAIATLAFSFFKGFGIAIAAVGAGASLLMLENGRALQSAGPLIGLAFYRVLRESHPDTVRALDLGQHYAVIGMAFGMLAALFPTEWVQRRWSESLTSGFGRLIWSFILALIPVAMAVVLGAKGIVGFVAGLGFAAFVDGLRGGSSILPIALTGGLGALVAVSYNWFTKLLDLTREEKQIAFYWIAGVALGLGALVAFVSKPETVEPEVASE
ncbi:MAG TPA: hypothetical protein VJ835_10545 [Fimbriimonadaceae bacterium]|nr:hypothetical protein [Fimbriimonadaceae bacterium]